MPRINKIGTTPTPVSDVSAGATPAADAAKSQVAAKSDLASRTQKGAAPTVRNAAPAASAPAASSAAGPAPSLRAVLPKFQAAQAAQGVSPARVQLKLDVLRDMETELGADHAGLLGDAATADKLFNVYQGTVRAMFPGESTAMVDFARHALADLRDYAVPEAAAPKARL